MYRCLFALFVLLNQVHVLSTLYEGWGYAYLFSSIYVSHTFLFLSNVLNPSRSLLLDSIFQAASNYYTACRKHRQQKLAEAAEAAGEEHPRTIQGVRRAREAERYQQLYTVLLLLHARLRYRASFCPSENSSKALFSVFFVTSVSLRVLVKVVSIVVGEKSPSLSWSCTLSMVGCEAPPPPSSPSPLHSLH